MPTGEQLVPQSMEGIELYAPLIAIGLGGLASMTPQYKDQSAVLMKFCILPIGSALVWLSD